MLNAWPILAQVRIAQPADEAALYDALVSLYEDNDVAGGYVASCVEERIAQGVSKASETGGIVGIIDAPDGRIAATIGIFPNVPWYTDEVLLVENWLFVRREYRTFGLHRRLFDFGKSFRDEMSAELGRPLKLISSVSSNTRLKAKMRLWSRFGRLIGGMFLVED